MEFEQPSVSVCTIMRDERRRVEDFIAQLEDFADEIVIVDTGSSDGTAEAIQAYQKSHPSAPVVFLSYMNPAGFHYGEAKNYSIDHATKEYVIILDADERLSEGFKQGVHAFLRDQQPDVASATRVDMVLPHLIDRPDRIIRRASGVRYGAGPRFRVHEQLEHTGASVPFSGVIQHDQLWNHYVVRPQRIMYQLELQIDRTPKTKSMIGHWIRGVWYFCYRFNKIYFKRNLYKDGTLGFKYAFIRAVDAFLIEFFVGLKPQREG